MRIQAPLALPPWPLAPKRLETLGVQGAWKAWAFFKRDLLTDASYKLCLALQALHVLVAIAAYYFLARLLGETHPQGYGAFPFILVGIMVNGYMTTALVCFAQAIRANQLTGTLKAMLATPTSPVTVIGLSSLYPFARAALDASVYLLGGTLFGLSLARANHAGGVLVFLFSLLAFSSVGIGAAAFTLVFKRGDPLLWLYGSLSWLLSGVFYPVGVLPPFLQQAAQWLPLTHAVDGMRAALLNGSDVADLGRPLTALALFGCVGLPLSVIALGWGLRQARITGSLGHN